jgi:hypothetical protein
VLSLERLDYVNRRNFSRPRDKRDMTVPMEMSSVSATWLYDMFPSGKSVHPVKPSLDTAKFSMQYSHKSIWEH